MKPEHVTKTVERKREYSSRAVMIYNVYPDEVYYEPREDYPELWNLSVHDSKKEEAKGLVMEFYNLGPNPTKKVALPIVERLVGMCEIPYERLSDLEKWDRTAAELPGDIGGPNREKFIDIISQRCEGNVLEAMAGFNSYVKDSSQISKVVAMDYSKEMLMRYPALERDRILFDLNKISLEGARMDFFKDGEFDIITCCYGVNYLAEPVSVFKEFNRILSPEGRFLALGNTAAGYPDLSKRWFYPKATMRDMDSAGFSSFMESFPDLKTENEISDCYLVSGIKGS